MPEAGQYLWDWYFEISDSLRRCADGVCFPIPWTEYKAWVDLTGTLIHDDELAILREMDVAFCSETNVELKAFHEREADRQRIEIERGKNG